MARSFSALVIGDFLVYDNKEGKLHLYLHLLVKVIDERTT